MLALQPILCCSWPPVDSEINPHFHKASTTLLLPRAPLVPHPVCQAGVSAVVPAELCAGHRLPWAVTGG